MSSCRALRRASAAVAIMMAAIARELVIRILRSVVVVVLEWDLLD